MTTTDAYGTVTNTIDALGRTTKIVDQANGVTQMGYDLVSNMTSLVDPSGNQTIFSFDGLDRETGDTNQLGASDTFSYNAAGEVTEETDKDGRVRRFQYDDLGRETSEAWNPTTAAASVTINVVQHGSGGHTDTIQDISLPPEADGGAWTLTLNGQTTTPIAYRPSAPDVQAALAAVGGDVSVTGAGTTASPFVVDFGAAQAGTAVSAMTAASNFIYANPLSVTETTRGGAATDTVYDVQFYAADGATTGFELGEYNPRGTLIYLGLGEWEIIHIRWADFDSGESADAVQLALNQLFANAGSTCTVSGVWPDFTVTFATALRGFSLIGNDSGNHGSTVTQESGTSSNEVEQVSLAPVSGQPGVAGRDDRGNERLFE